jgi:citrate lyase subunit beta / citryl-CoA lyase
MGFHGKFAIHPSQPSVIDDAFCPSVDEVGYARRVKEAYELARRDGSGSTKVDGRMVDEPVYRRACRVVESAAER